MYNDHIKVWGLLSLFTAEFLPPILKNTYNYTIMIFSEELQMALGISISIATIVTILAGAIRWLVKHYFEDIKKELLPNSGTSMKDQITRLETKTDRLEAKIEKLYEILLKK